MALVSGESGYICVLSFDCRCVVLEALTFVALVSGVSAYIYVWGFCLLLCFALEALAFVALVSGVSAHMCVLSCVCCWFCPCGTCLRGVGLRRVCQWTFSVLCRVLMVALVALAFKALVSGVSARGCLLGCTR